MVTERGRGQMEKQVIFINSQRKFDTQSKNVLRQQKRAARQLRGISAIIQKAKAKVGRKLSQEARNMQETNNTP